MAIISKTHRLKTVRDLNNDLALDVTPGRGGLCLIDGTCAMLAS